MKRGTITHPKTRQLAGELGIPLLHAVGLLEALWHFTAEYAPCGDVGKFTDEHIGRGVHWTDDASALIAALCSVGWLDADAEHRLLVHDWHHHVDGATRKRMGRAGLSLILPNGQSSRVPHPDAEPGSQARTPEPDSVSSLPSPPGPAPPLPSPPGQKNPPTPLAQPTAAQRFDVGPEVENAWQAIPKRHRKAKGRFRDAWVLAVQGGAEPAAIADGLRRYYLAVAGRTRYVRQPARFVTDEGWLEDEEAWANDDDERTGQGGRGASSEAGVGGRGAGANRGGKRRERDVSHVPDL